jgi:hypothetical protein
MSYFNGVPMALLYEGPDSDYPAAAAASTAAQSLMVGATTDFTQPYIPQGFFQLGSKGQLVIAEFDGVLTGQASATTAIITIGLASANNSIAGTTLIASTAITVTSLSAVGWNMRVKLGSRANGYGTTATSSNFRVSGLLTIGTTNLVAVAPPVLVNNIDASVTQWIYASVTFSTSSATNSCTLQQVTVFGSSA